MISLDQSEILNRINNNLSLLNSRLSSFRIEYMDNSLTAEIQLYIDLLNNKTKLILKFEDVKEYSFFYSKEYFFYNVENYKFIISDNYVFLSLDPVNDEPQRAEEDQDYVLADRVYGFIDII